MSESLKEIPVDSVIVSGFNPRKTFDSRHIKELAGSIRRDGQWNPIIVRQRSNHYELIAGECRLRAIKKLGLTTIQARVLDIDDNEAHLLALKTNTMRRDLNPVEEAYGIKKLVNKGWSIKRVAKELDKSDTWVYSRLKLAENATEGLQNAVIKQIIPLTHAIKISELPEGLQGPLVEKIVRERLIFKEVAFLVGLLKEAETPEKIEFLFKARREIIMNWASGRNPFSGKEGINNPGVSTIECGCGTEFIVDWAGRRIVSKQNYVKGSFLKKALRFLHREG